MPDPNATYKQAFADLTVKLGRTPTCKDKEWVTIGEELRKAWMPANEPTSRTPSDNGRTDNATTRPTMARQESGDPEFGSSELRGSHEASEGRATRGDNAIGAVGINTREEAEGDALYGPGVIQTGAVAASEPGAPIAPSRFSEGARGPSGGLMCRCEVCGVLWERERKRGRPAYRCPGCRQ